MILYALPVFWVLRHEFNEHKDELEVYRQNYVYINIQNKSHWFLELVSHKFSGLSD